MRFALIVTLSAVATLAVVSIGSAEDKKDITNPGATSRSSSLGAKSRSSSLQRTPHMAGSRRRSTLQFPMRLAETQLPNG